MTVLSCHTAQYNFDDLCLNTKVIELVRSRQYNNLFLLWLNNTKYDVPVF